MKNLTKVLLILLLVSISSQLNAQVKFGLKAGLNGNNISKDLEPDSDDELYTSKLSFSYHIGATVELGLSDVLSLQSGLLYTTKGWAVDIDEVLKEDIADGLEFDGYYRFMFSYLEVPVNIAYKFGNIQVYAGPYISLMLSGKEKYDITMTELDESHTESDERKYVPVFGEVKDGDIDDENMAAYGLDYGLNAGVGYRIGQILITAGYSYSMSNIIPAYEGETEMRDNNRISPNTISLSATYFFGL